MKFNHNGTHIEGMGLKQGEHRVIFNINAHDNLEGEMRRSLCLQNKDDPCHSHGKAASPPGIVVVALHTNCVMDCSQSKEHGGCQRLCEQHGLSRAPILSSW